MTEPRTQRQHEQKFVKIARAVMEISSQTDRQTDILITVRQSPSVAYYMTRFWLIDRRSVFRALVYVLSLVLVLFFVCVCVCIAFQLAVTKLSRILLTSIESAQKAHTSAEPERNSCIRCKLLTYLFTISLIYVYVAQRAYGSAIQWMFYGSSTPGWHGDNHVLYQQLGRSRGWQ